MWVPRPAPSRPPPARLRAEPRCGWGRSPPGGAGAARERSAAATAGAQRLCAAFAALLHPAPAAGAKRLLPARVTRLAQGPGDPGTPSSGKNWEVDRPAPRAASRWSAASVQEGRNKCNFGPVASWFKRGPQWYVGSGRQTGRLETQMGHPVRWALGCARNKPQQDLGVLQAWATLRRRANSDERHLTALHLFSLGHQIG